MTDDHPTNNGIDTTIPNVARVWDYQLGGKDNFEVDRAAADALNEACRRVGAPDGREVARKTEPSSAGPCATWPCRPASTSSSTSAPGCPPGATSTRPPRRSTPDAEVVYVDYDPMVLAHGRALLADERQNNSHCR